MHARAGRGGSSAQPLPWTAGPKIAENSGKINRSHALAAELNKLPVTTERLARMMRNSTTPAAYEA